MEEIKNCKSLNEASKVLFGKVNYYNRCRIKKILSENNIDWKEFFKTKKATKEKRFCLQCGRELTTKNAKKFCCSSCAAKYNNVRRPKKVKEKISNTLRRRYNGLIEEEKRYCVYCGNELTTRRQTKYCSVDCEKQQKQKDYITRWKDGKESGLSGEYGISSHIRKYLFDKYDCKCQLCGWGIKNEYTNKYPLEVHHIDGDYANNKEENLQLLCPNCHSLTESYKAHNKNGRKSREKYN